MKTIEPFQKLGWHTVPLKGKLERLEGGVKSIPKFESGWRQTYQETVNTVKAKLGGTITGECSGIIAIDCDNENTWNMFKALDPDYEFVFISKGKGYPAGTLIYKFDEDLPTSFSLADNSIALDIYANNGFIYLPTDANTTKEPMLEIPELKVMPSTTKLLLQQLHLAKNRPSEEATVGHNVDKSSCLAPLVEQFVVSKDYMPGLFKIITPRDFRKEEQYIKSGHLHPENIPDGRGSEYLIKVSAILGADSSVSLDLYVSAMNLINSLWNTPMEDNKFESTVLDPMLNSTAKINGKIIWQYNEDWKQHRLVLHTKRQSNLELGFDDNRNLYYCVDVVNEHVKQFGRDTELQSYIEATAINTPKKAELKRNLPILNVVAKPSLPFGFSFDDDSVVKTLNTFKHTPELMILNHPSDYKEYYKRPTTTLKYFETLVPEESMRNYLLGFTKRKLTNFEYSPVILYFLGAHGSGKDTYVGILEQIMGHVARPTTKEFLEVYNAWLLDTYFVQLDEYGNQLTRISDKEEALGKLKTYTGKQQVMIRAMRTDGFPYKHNATFIMTANKNPLMLEDGDRRIAFLPTPNVLSKAEWVVNQGGITVIHKQIMSEIKDFCYYLATEVEMLAPQEYMVPPESESKLSLIADSMFASQRIAYALSKRMFDYVKELCIDFDAKTTLNAINNEHLTEDNVEPLYMAMTEMQGDMRSLSKAMRGMGIEVHNGTYKLFDNNPFEAEEED
tara:strand:+ start:4191 stop:6386 length:2196 start_codon:yes stop_codon:yes gene_type:complete